MANKIVVAFLLPKELNQEKPIQVAKLFAAIRTDLGKSRQERNWPIPPDRADDRSSQSPLRSQIPAHTRVFKAILRKVRNPRD